MKLNFVIKGIKYPIFFSVNKFYSTRVRFAPSPTGLLHVGGLKTVFINYLFSKSTGGKLILRIEDTDRSRYDSKAIAHLIKSFNWLNIHFDEGIVNNEPDPNYIQSNRLQLYKDGVDHLIKENKAYHCFCSNQRLDFLRKQQTRQGENPGYDRKCLNLTKSDIERKLLQQMEYTVRLKLDGHSPVSFYDHIFGNITIPLCNVESDPIIFKSDGYPVYHLANVIDDHDMAITHVIRGQEWLISTPKHITIYEAFGWKAPIFAHLPLILTDKGTKLSKRDPGFLESCYNIDLLIGRGFTPDSIKSWLMSCGGGLTVDWYPLITFPQLIEKFSLSRLTTHNAKLSEDILDITGRAHINHINLSEDYFNEIILPFLKHNSVNLDYVQFHCVFDKIKKHLSCFGDIMHFSYIWSHCPVKVESLFDILGEEQLGRSKIEVIMELLNRFIVILQTDDDSIPHLSEIHNSLCRRAVAMKCLRMFIISRVDGPKITELLSLFSKEELIRRLNSVILEFECNSKNILAS